MYSRIYQGVVTHRRLRPKSHAFHYQLFMMYIDLDELDDVVSCSRFWSRERFNLATFKRKDYHRPEIANLKEAVQQTLRDKTGLELDGPVRILTHLRYFGHCMNPVTFYYCFDQDGVTPRAVMAEIQNTPWNERYQYVHVFSPDGHYDFDKKFHVSPFFPMNMSYQWDLDVPHDKLSIKMSSQLEGKNVFYADLVMSAREISKKGLNQVLVRFPFMTMKVVAGIYWQAAKIWFKKIPFYSHPEVKSQKSFLRFKGEKK